MKLHLSAFIALVASATYLACSSDKQANDDDGGSGGKGGASGGRGGSSNVGEGAGDSGGEVGQAGESATGGGGGKGGTGGSSSGGKGGGSGGGAGGKGGASGGGSGGSGALGGAGTGSTEEAGIVTFDTFAFYRPALVSGSDGVLHLAFNTNTSPSNIFYASCAADCGVGANWTATILDEQEFTGNVRMVIGSDDRLHVLYDTGGAEQLVYGTCANDCGDASNWTGIDLASLFGGGWNSPTNGSPLVIDAEGRVSFTVDRKIYLDGGLTLATCAGDCTELGNWSAGTISPTGTRTSLAARGTTLHQLVDNAGGSTTGTTLGYRTCAGDCTDPANWAAADNLFVYDGVMPNAIAVTAEGGVRIAYNQGISDSGQPADVKAQDNSMLIWGCDADCLEPTSWSGIISGVAGDGVDGISMAESGGALVLAVSNNNRILTRVCTADCLLDTNWSEGEIDTSAAMTSEYDPMVFAASSCGSATLEFATWHLTQGVTAIRPNGSLAFAHTTNILRSCFGSTTVDYLPGYGRVAYLP